MPIPNIISSALIWVFSTWQVAAERGADWQGRQGEERQKQDDCRPAGNKTNKNFYCLKEFIDLQRNLFTGFDEISNRFAPMVNLIKVVMIKNYDSGVVLTAEF